MWGSYVICMGTPQGVEGPLSNWRQAEQSPSMTVLRGRVGFIWTARCRHWYCLRAEAKYSRFSAAWMPTLLCNPVAKDPLSRPQQETWVRLWHHVPHRSPKDKAHPALRLLRAFLSGASVITGSSHCSLLGLLAPQWGWKLLQDSGLQL